MASNKIQRFGPTAMVTGATGSNYLNPGSAGTAVGYTATADYFVVRHIRIVNKGTGASTFSLYIGGTTGSAAGTEFMGNAVSVGQNAYLDWYGAVRLDAADFLSGTASVATTLTIEGEGEVGKS